MHTCDMLTLKYTHIFTHTHHTHQARTQSNSIKKGRVGWTRLPVGWVFQKGPEDTSRV